VNQEIAAWVFGSVLLVFLLTVFTLDRFVFRDRGAMSQEQSRLLGIFCAVLAGSFAFFFTGTLGIEFIGTTAGAGKMTAQATGGIAAFVFVLWWWRSGYGPVQSSRPRPRLIDHDVKS
jgi:hypothetical protein